METKLKFNDEINRAIAAFSCGKLVAIPTETVYGLAAPINNLKLLEKIFLLKERPFFDPLIVHVANIDQAKSIALQWTELADKIAKHFWPGPLTMILKKNHKINHLISAGLNTVGVRCPDNLLTLALIEQLNQPLAAPSANKFKKTSPTTAAHVAKYFSQKDVYILEYDHCKVGIESTIIDVQAHSVKILRPGIITQSDFKKLNIPVDEDSDYQSIVPGGMEDHYMPHKPLFLTLQKSQRLIENILKQKQLNSYFALKLPDNPLLAARSLYQILHQDIAQDAMVCMLNEAWYEDEKWQAILDRLKKASSGML